MLITRSNFVLRLRAALLVFVCSLIAGSNIHAQQPTPSATSEDTLRAIDLYRQDKLAEAATILNKVVKEHEDDAEAWYYLGLINQRQGFNCEAIGAFEKVTALRPDFVGGYSNLAKVLIRGRSSQSDIAKATAQRSIELGDNSAEMHYVIGDAYLREYQPAKALEEADTALQIKPELSRALLLKSLAQLGLNQYQAAAESLERFLALSPDDSDVAAWRIQLESLRALAAESVQLNASRTVFSPKQVTEKAHILHKPEPQYTEAARKACLSGTIVLRGVLADDGTVKNLLVLKPLDYGLTTAAINAARSMKFTPANIDGRPVSQFMQIEYNFNLY